MEIKESYTLLGILLILFFIFVYGLIYYIPDMLI